MNHEVPATFTLSKTRFALAAVSCRLSNRIVSAQNTDQPAIPRTATDSHRPATVSRFFQLAFATHSAGPVARKRNTA
jgi:hypothetical protein